MLARLGALALVAMVFAGCSGNEVKGIVREEGTGEPLSGATVRMGDEIARTDEGGEFELDVDDDTPAIIVIEAPGYDPQQVDLNMQNGEPLPADVSLQKEAEERQQTRAKFMAEQEKLDAREQKLEDEERRLYEARRDFNNQRGPAEQRDQALQRFDAWQKRLDADEEKLEADERALYEARRDFDTHAIDTWTPAATNEDAAEDRAEQQKDAATNEDAAEDRAEREEDANEDAAERVRKADEEAAERAEDARDDR